MSKTHLQREKRRHRYAIVSILVFIGILFAPSFGNYRVLGLFGFLIIGIPCYLLTLKDLVQAKNAQPTSAKRCRLKSISLLLFGLLSLSFGVAIDAYLIYQVISNPSLTSLSLVVQRLLSSIPFIAFGIVLIKTAIGKPI